MRIVVLFNLKEGVTPEDYEAWAVEKDIPTVRGLASIDSFRVHRLTGVMMGEGAVPFQYVEIIDVADPDGFGAEVATPEMQRISAEFQALADKPIFLTTAELGAA